MTADVEDKSFSKSTMKKCTAYHIISGALYAGAEVMVYNLLHSMHRDSSVNVQAILFNKGLLFDKLYASGIPVRVLDERRLNIPRLSVSLRTILASERPDIVHCHGFKENILSYLSSSTLRTRPRLVATLHGLPEKVNFSKNHKYSITMMVNYFLLRRFYSGIVAVSSDIAHKLESNYCFPNSKIHVIRNGIRISSSRLHEPKTRFVIGSAGRLFAVKNYTLLVDIAKIVCRTEPAIQFVVAGDGPEQVDLLKRIHRQGLEDNVRLIGFTDDMPGFYQALSVYMNTSLHEGIPMTILEAMACGLPVVAPQVGGIKEIITSDQQGFLIENHSAPEFAEKCLALYHSRRLWEHVSTAARQRILDSFDIHRTAEQYAYLYASILADHN